MKKVIFLIIFFQVALAFSQISEYTVKAVYLERFTRFMEWPSSVAIQDTTKEFILGIIGENPFDNKLEEIYSEQKIKDKKVRIVYYETISQIDKCHLLYIARTDNDKLFKILSYCSNKPILTVSDTGGFGGYGVHINFFLVDNKIKFEINEKSLVKSGLKCSYLLLKSAKVINPVGGER